MVVVLTVFFCFMTLNPKLLSFKIFYYQDFLFCNGWPLRSLIKILVDDQMSDQEDTETSASTLPRPRSATEGSAFDENSLNQPQFIHLLEKFLGNTPIK